MFAQTSGLKIFHVLLVLLMFAAQYSYAQNREELEQIVQSRADSVLSVAFAQNTGRVIASVRSGQGGQLIVISLADCQEDRRYNFDSAIPTILIAGNDPSAVWGSQGSMLKKWSISDGSEIFAQQLTGNEAIKGITQSENGTIIAVWSNTQVAVVQLGANNQNSLLWNRQFNSPVSAVTIDGRAGYVYIGSSDGVLDKRSLSSGAQANSFQMDYPVLSLAADYQRGHVIIGTGSQLIKFDSNNNVFSRISTLPAYDVSFSDDLRYLAVIGDRGYTIFTYPDMRTVQTQSQSTTKLALLPGGSAVTFNNNILRFYDNNRRKNAGSVFIFDNTIGFVAPDLNFYGNDLFRTAISNNQVSGVSPFVAEDRRPDRQLACAAFRDMLTPLVSLDSGVDRPAVAAPSRPAVTTPQAPSVAQPVRPNATAPQAPSTPGVTAPTAPSAATQPSSPSMPSSPGGATMPQTAARPNSPDIVVAPIRPEIPPVERPNMAPGTNIPSWVLNPNALPPYSAVKSGVDTSSALREARIKIRDDIARNVMRTMLDVEMVRNIDDMDVKKHFLWMVAGRTSQLAAGYVIQKDMWVSPQGQYYVLGQVDLETVNQIYEPTFREEMEQLMAYGNAAYLQREAVRWD